ncbi:MAG TPA: LegC family aminotransferase [Steroidobacteraceae bacterium]|jgi:perosamine synthetase|nr:LegC family aminotransferase [Steroidobacteraceae bacterium]
MSAAPVPALAAQIVAAIRRVVGAGTVALHEPRFAGNEWTYLRECLDSTFVSSVGRFVDRFEADLAALSGAKFAVAVVNGTAALHVALRLAGVRQADEVLVPALSFIATSNAVAYCGAVPHFVDSEERTLGMDPRALREYLTAVAEQRAGLCLNRHTGRVIRALVPMHVFGHPADVDGLAAVARDFHLAMIEDAAESIGSFYHGAHTGTLGLMGTLSFNGNKTVTTGGGGAVLTNDAGLARHAKHLTTTAKVSHPWEYRHDELGYNYRLPNLNAALGCAQLEQLPQLLEAKRRLYERYAQEFASIPGVRLVQEPPGCRSNYWLQTLLLDASLTGERDALLAASNGAGVATRPVWSLNHRAPAFCASPRMPLPVAESLERRIINLPSSAQLVLPSRQRIPERF